MVRPLQEKHRDREGSGLTRRLHTVYLEVCYTGGDRQRTIVLTEGKGHDSPWDGQTDRRENIFRGGSGKPSEKARAVSSGNGVGRALDLREKPTASSLHPLPFCVSVTFISGLLHCPTVWLPEPSEVSAPSNKP